jgi:glycosyltransferase involved in cell wall biosynthesis
VIVGDEAAGRSGAGAETEARPRDIVTVHLLLHPFVNDNRVLRAAQSSRKYGPTTVLALLEAGLPREEEVDGCRVRRIALRTRPLAKRAPVQVLKYLEAVWRFRRAGRSLRPQVVHAHDLDTLPIGYLVARSCGARLIYDSHELWSSAPHMDRQPAWVTRARLSVERWLARKADQVIAVSDGIADVMAREMQIRRPAVVNNMPPLPPAGGESPGPLRRSLNLGPDVPILLYQGKFAPTKGVELLVEAMKSVTHRGAVLVLLGEGPLEPRLRTMAASEGLAGRVLLHPSVPGKELHAWTRDATIGLYAVEGGHLSKRLSLANKFFEYVQAGLALIVTDMPEMRKLVDRYGLGETVPPADAPELARRIDALLGDPTRLARYRAAAERAAVDMDRNRGGAIDELYRGLAKG